MIREGLQCVSSSYRGYLRYKLPMKLTLKLKIIIRNCAMKRTSQDNEIECDCWVNMEGCGMEVAFDET